MLIIPAIDLRDGKAVRLEQGDFAREKIYDADPVAVATSFAEQGAEWLHVVDLEGARGGEPVHWEVIGSLAKVGLKMEFGGGVRSLTTAKRLLDLGVERVVVGTRLVTNPGLAAEFFRELSDRVVAGIDARDGFVAVAGWESESAVLASDLAVRVAEQGCRRIILTDIARDGMQSGPNLVLLKAIQSAAGLPTIQSGGIGNLEHIKSLTALGRSAPEGVIVGRALYEGSVSLAEALAIADEDATLGTPWPSYTA